MIVDTSALVAMIRGEVDAQRYTEIISGAGTVRLSAANYVELSVVIDGLRDPIASSALDDVLAAYHIRIEPLTATQARLARTAYRQFGKGSGHPARLNMGDCFAYALARETGEPLLFKGIDFTLTDIELVIEPIKHRRLSEIMAAYGVATP